MAEGKISQNILHKDDDGNNWLLITKAPLRNADGEIIGMVGINRDITQLKQSQDELEHTISELKSAEERLQLLITGARALLWYAIITRNDAITDNTPEALNWNNYISSEEAAQQFLPLDVQAGETYVQAWQRHVFDDDQNESRWRSYKAVINNDPTNHFQRLIKPKLVVRSSSGGA